MDMVNSSFGRYFHCRIIFMVLTPPLVTILDIPFSQSVKKTCFYIGIQHMHNVNTHSTLSSAEAQEDGGPDRPSPIITSY